MLEPFQVVETSTEGYVKTYSFERLWQMKVFFWIATAIVAVLGLFDWTEVRHKND